MSRLRPIHYVAAAAFGAGVLVTLLAVIAFGGSSKKDDSLSQARVATSTAVARTTPAATASASSVTPQPVPTILVVPLQPAIPGLVQPTPLIATPTALQQPGACTQDVEPGYLAKAVPALQQLSSQYQGWSTAPITTSSVQMHNLQQILGGFTQGFDAITPVPDGCAFVHNSLIRAAQQLNETAGRVDLTNSAALHAGWEAEYRGRAFDMKNAIDLYVSSTRIPLAPRPFANAADLAVP